MFGTFENKKGADSFSVSGGDLIKVASFFRFSKKESPNNLYRKDVHLLLLQYWQAGHV